MKDKNNQDVPVEEVNKVIKESEDEDESNNPNEGYLDLSEEVAKKELDTMLVPGSEEEYDYVEPNYVEPNEDELIIKKQQIVNQVKPIYMKLLQFECENCKLKTYINLEDDKLNNLKEKVKCIGCGKKKSTKKRILNITLHGYIDIVKEEDKVDEELVEDKK